MNIQIAGENSLIIYFDDEGIITPAPFEQSIAKQSITKKVIPQPNAIKSNPDTSERVQRLYHLIQQRLIKDNCKDMVIDLVPSYASILVIFDLFKCDHHKLRQKLRACFIELQEDVLINKVMNSHRVIELPAYYNEQIGPDLLRIAKHASLSVAEVIDIHQACEYHVYAIGFAPGFAYLGNVDERITMPRLSSPREKVPKGAIAIADQQTAVYPAESPGGWNIIGLCPVNMFNPDSESTMPVQVGDKVKFTPIDKVTFISLGGLL